MPYPQGSIVTKNNMINDFNSIVITGRNNLVFWSTDSSSDNPFDPQNSFGTLVSSLSDTNPLAGSTTSNISAGDLQALVEATDIFNVFIGRANQAARIRTVRLLKYLNRTGFASSNGYNQVYDQTKIGSMNSRYSANYLASDFNLYPQFDALIDASDLDNFVTSISQKITAQSNARVTFSEYYCHSSCHNSCHNSRGRR